MEVSLKENNCLFATDQSPRPILGDFFANSSGHPDATQQLSSAKRACVQPDKENNNFWRENKKTG
jgi:hypothetical protein